MINLQVVTQITKCTFIVFFMTLTNTEIGISKEDNPPATTSHGRSDITSRPKDATRIGRCVTDEECTEYFIDVTNELKDLISSVGIYKNHEHHCKVWNGHWSDSGCNSFDKRQWVCFREKKYSSKLESYSQTWRTQPFVGKQWCLDSETQYPSELAWSR